MTAPETAGPGAADMADPDGVATAELLCPACAEPVSASDLFCESCGYQLSAVPVAGTAATPRAGTAETGGAVDGPRPCGHCGAPSEMIDDDGYCRRCGIHQSQQPDRLQTDLGTAAVVSDRGLRHHRNEDAYAISVSGERTAVVVCDGVSSTANPDQASAAAAKAALDTIALSLGDGPWPGPQAVGEILTEAIHQAQKAVAEVPPSEPGGFAALPLTTIVTAIVAPGAIVVANVGDSRAYWLATTPARHLQLSVDDSWAEAAIAAGVPPEKAYAAPAAHVITQWLGADATELETHVATFAVDEPGTVLVCSDGLWNYFESADQLAALVGSAGAGAPPLAVAGRLVDAAIAAGGQDNITVAVIPGHPAHQVSTQPQE